MLTAKVSAILAASCVGVIGLQAVAAPLVTYSVLGRITGSGANFGSIVTVSAGQSVDIRLVAGFAPLGSVNRTLTWTDTLTSIAATDGFNNLPTVSITPTNPSQIAGSFSSRVVVETDPDTGDPIATTTFSGALASGWDQSVGYSAGYLSGTSIREIKAIRAPGNFATTATSQISYRATYSVTSITGTYSLLQLDLTDGASGFKAHLNNGALATAILATSETEKGSPYYPVPDPYFQLNSLALVSPLANTAPSFAQESGLQSGDTGIDAALDLIYPLNLQTHFKTFTISDSLMTDESPSSTVVTLGPGALSGVNAPLAGHMSIIGRNIVISGNYLDVQNMLGTYAIPLMLTDSQGSSSNGTFALQIVPEPLETGLLGLGGLSLVRRRRTN